MAIVRGTEEAGILKVTIKPRKKYLINSPRLRRIRSGKRLPSVVSMHLPKTAGTSFRLFLQELYGEGFRSMYEEKETAPRLLHTVKLKERDRCLHGHFQATAYEEKLPGAIKLTWLRDPVERVVSSYFQYLRQPEEARGSQFSERFFTEGWGLMDFARSEEIRYQLVWYFDAVPLEDFFFVGITECYEQSLDLLRYQLKQDGPAQFHNVNRNPRRHPSSFYELSTGQRRNLESILEWDLDLYWRARYRLEKQLKQAFGDQAPALPSR
jgi:hypothetical protein